MTTQTVDSDAQAVQHWALDSQIFRALTSDADCSPRDWLMVLNRRPVLRQRLLLTINDCHRAVPRPVASVSQAVVQLGFNTVRNMARTLMC